MHGVPDGMLGLLEKGADARKVVHAAHHVQAAQPPSWLDAVCQHTCGCHASQKSGPSELEPGCYTESKNGPKMLVWRAHLSCGHQIGC